MLNKISIWGAVAALVYFSFAGAMYWNATNCHGTFCDVGMGLAVWPWALVWGSGTKWFWIAAIINVLILYFLFAAVQRWAKK